MHTGSEKSLWDSFFCPVGGSALQALHWAGSKHLHLLSISEVSERFQIHVWEQEVGGLEKSGKKISVTDFRCYLSFRGWWKLVVS